MLIVNNLTSYYSNIKILKNLSFNLNQGQVLCLLGRNGAGKTTTLKSIMGLVDKTRGSILFNNEKLSGIPAHYIPKKGIGYVPQGRRLFSELTVEENLEIGLLARKKGKDTKDKVLSMFPRLKERINQISGTLSGGEQQMLAIGRSLVINPSVIMLDEPSQGLAPMIVEDVKEMLIKLKKEGMSIILVEQNLKTALDVADRVYILDQGEIVFEGKSEELSKNKKLTLKFLGVST